MGGVICNNAFSIALSMAFSMALSLFLCTSLVSCAGGAGSGSDDAGGEPTSLCVQMPVTRSAQYELSDVESFTVTIKSSAYSATKSCGQGERISFTNLPVGHYDVTAYGKKSDGRITAKGSASVDIEANVTKTVTIRLSRLTHCTVSFKTEEGGDISGISSQDVNVGDKATNPGTPSIPGKTFSFWAKRISSTEISGTSFDFNTPITEDIELVAKCDAVTYSITFDYNGGKVGTAESSTVSVEYGQTPTPSAEPTWTGHEFLGWATSASSPTATGIVPVTLDTAVITTYYAVWQLETYTITYDSTSMTYGILNAASPNSYTYGTAVTIPDAGGAGTTFAGWYTDAALTTAFTGITATTTGNLELYAKFTASVTYHMPTGLSATVAAGDYDNYILGKGLSALPTLSNITLPSGTSLTLEGWYEDSAYTPAKKVTSIASTATGDKDLYAKFTATVSIYNKKTGAYASDLIATQNVVYGGTATAPATPTRTGYTFNNVWNTDSGSGVAVTFTFGTGGTVITSDRSVWATWTANSYNITYNVRSKGILPADASTTYTYMDPTDSGVPFTLATPSVNEPSKYTFDGWYESSDFSGTAVTEIAKGTTGAKTYYAKYLFTATSVTCSVEDFAAIDGFSRTSVTWQVSSGSDLSAIVSAIASQGKRVNLDLSNCSMSSIGADAFSSISNYLTGLTIPASVTEVYCSAFDGCSRLSSITVGGTDDWETFYLNGTSTGTSVVMSSIVNSLKNGSENDYVLKR